MVPTKSDKLEIELNGIANMRGLNLGFIVSLMILAPRMTKLTVKHCNISVDVVYALMVAAPRLNAIDFYDNWFTPAHRKSILGDQVSIASKHQPCIQHITFSSLKYEDATIACSADLLYWILTNNNNNTPSATSRTLRFSGLVNDNTPFIERITSNHANAGLPQGGANTVGSLLFTELFLAYDNRQFNQWIMSFVQQPLAKLCMQFSNLNEFRLLALHFSQWFMITECLALHYFEYENKAEDEKRWSTIFQVFGQSIACSPNSPISIIDISDVVCDRYSKSAFSDATMRWNFLHEFEQFCQTARIMIIYMPK
jgi:hypothetical protein